MQISHISSIGFYGNATKKVAKTISNKIENPMTQFVKETKGIHEYAAPRQDIKPINETFDPAKVFYPHRQAGGQVKNKTAMPEIKQADIF